MKNVENWRPTKFILRRGRFIANRDIREVHVGSRLIGDLTARLYQQYIPLYFSGRLVDLGCGKVPFYELYKKHVTNSVCVDWPGTLHGGNFLDVSHDLTQPLPFGNQEFDCILLSDVLEHIPNPAQLCDEMARILTPSGILILNVPFFYWLHETPFDYYRYTSFALEKLLGDAGFEVLHLEATGGVLEVMVDIFSKHLGKLPLVGKPLTIVLQSLTFQLTQFRMYKKVLEKSARRFPLSYFVVARLKTNPGVI